MRKYKLTVIGAGDRKECKEQTGKVLAIGMQYRNIPWFRAFQRAVEQNLFGENMMVHFSDIREIRPKIAMRDAVYGNGGPLADMARSDRVRFKSQQIRFTRSGAKKSC